MGFSEDALDSSLPAEPSGVFSKDANWHPGWILGGEIKSSDADAQVPALLNIGEHKRALSSL